MTYLYYYGAIAFVVAMALAAIQRFNKKPNDKSVEEALIICGLAIIWPVFFLIVIVMKIADRGEKP